MTPDKIAEAVLANFPADSIPFGLFSAISDAIRAAVEEDRRGRTLDSAEVEAIRGAADYWRGAEAGVGTTPLVAGIDRLLSDRAALLCKAHDALHGMDGYDRGWKDCRERAVAFLQTLPGGPNRVVSLDVVLPLLAAALAGPG